MKEKKVPQNEMADICKSAIKKESKSVEKEFFDDTEEVDTSDFEMLMDIDDTPVLSIDGVLMNTNDEEVSLLFYHHKPEGIDFEDEIIRCKGVAELRISRSKFNDIAKYFDEKSNNIKTNQREIDDLFSINKLSMFA